MAEARVRDEWGRTATLLALIANVNRDPKRTKAFKPSDFYSLDAPQPAASGIPLTKKNMQVLKQVFVRRKGA